jgi:hypothetical protein
MAKTPKDKASRTAARDVVVDDLDEASEVIDFAYSITAYGADYPVDSIVKRIESKDIVVPLFRRSLGKQNDTVGFQREYVWAKPKADRFIESLLLGLPVPGIFLVKEPGGRLLVLDGHQRLHTLKSFYDGMIHGEDYRLEGVQSQFAGKRYTDLNTEDRRRLDDSIIHATVIRQDEPSDDQSSIYLIFERLNTGGVNLQPQEIRVALYHGQFASVLRKLNEYRAWRRLFGGTSTRLKDMEMILRFFAFYYHQQHYRSPMKDFLNRYMAKNKNLESQDADELTELFHLTTDAIIDGIGSRAFRPVRAVNAAVIDSLMVGIARRLKHGPIRKLERLKGHYDNLLANKSYRDSTETGTSQEANVKNRMDLATAEFASAR